jgi:polysaccharide export outer membrane protein
MRLCIVLAALIVAACSSPRLVGNETLTVVSASELPAPARSDLAAEVRPFLIGPHDRIGVDVFGAPELSKTIQADASGRISYPLVGEIEAAGRTPDELAQLIEDRLRGRYVRNPDVTVNLIETFSQNVTVDGQVTRPGPYPVRGRMTLMRAVAVAGGTTEFARQSHVVVFRRADNRDYAALYNLGAIRQGYYPDPEIYANDVVVVGESQARRLFRDVVQAAGLLTTPIVAVLQPR